MKKTVTKYWYIGLALFIAAMINIIPFILVNSLKWSIVFGAVEFVLGLAMIICLEKDSHIIIEKQVEELWKKLIEKHS